MNSLKFTTVQWLVFCYRWTFLLCQFLNKFQRDTVRRSPSLLISRGTPSSPGNLALLIVNVNLFSGRVYEVVVRVILAEFFFRLFKSLFKRLISSFHDIYNFLYNTVDCLLHQNIWTTLGLILECVKNISMTVTSKKVKTWLLRNVIYHIYPPWRIIYSYM